MWIRSDDFQDNGPIPGECAFAVMDEESHVRLSENMNPHLEWGDVPEGTRSLALMVFDVDVPTSGEDVNKEDREVPPDLPRTEFTHWALIDIDPETTGISRGSYCTGVTAGGKDPLTGRPREGINDYTGWFDGDPDMGGSYHGYDGPGPPWNDSLIHRYHFVVRALDVASLDVGDGFTIAEAREAMEGHVLDEATLVGTYTLNPRLADA